MIIERLSRRLWTASVVVTACLAVPAATAATPAAPADAVAVMQAPAERVSNDGDPVLLEPPSQKKPVAAEHGLPVHPAKKPAQKSLEELPWANPEGIVPSAVEDPGTPFEGIIASPARSGVVVYDGPSGNHIAKLPVEQVVDSKTRLPVIDQEDGWYQVLLPSRMNLPSQRGPVNGGAAWVQTVDVTVQKSDVEVAIDLSDGEVNVLEGDKEIARFDVIIDGGAATVRGRSFNLAKYTTDISAQCSTEPLLVLAAQLEDSDGYLEQKTAMTAVHGFSRTCMEGSGYTEQTPGCTIISDSDMRTLLSLVPVGSPVTIRD